MEPVEAVVKHTYLYPLYSAFMSFIQNIDFYKFRQIRINPRLNESRSIAKSKNGEIAIVRDWLGVTKRIEE